MKKLSIGDVSITSMIERDGPWRTPREMFPSYDPIIGKRHIAELDFRSLRSDIGQNGHHLSDLYRAHAEAHGAHRYMYRRGQRLSAADGLFETALAGWLRGRGPAVAPTAAAAYLPRCADAGNTRRHLTPSSCSTTRSAMDTSVTPCRPSAARAMHASTHSLKADSIEASWGRIMGRPAKFRFFTCPSCAARYQVVMAEAGPET